MSRARTTPPNEQRSYPLKYISAHTASPRGRWRSQPPGSWPPISPSLGFRATPPAFHSAARAPATASSTRHHPLFCIHHTRIPHAPRNPGSISPCFHVFGIPVSAFRSSLSGLTDLRTRQTRNSVPELPPHTTPPRTGLDYPHHYPPPTPFVSRHQAHSGTSVGAS